MSLRPHLLAIGLLTTGCSLDLDALRGSHEALPSGPGSAGRGEAVGGSGGDNGPPATGCGHVGLACCMPGSLCEDGACLRGTCRNFGGAFMRAPECGPACTDANIYTAGCSCPLGFTPIAAGSFDSCDGTQASLHACVGMGEASVHGAYQRDNDTFECRVVHPRTNTCSCPSGSTALQLPPSYASRLEELGRSLFLCLE